MTVLAVDLAAKFSAACLMRGDYSVDEQFDSWGAPEESFIYSVVGPWLFHEPEDVTLPDVLVIEDLPHGLNYTKLAKTVCRLQGRIVQAMHESMMGRVEDILFVAPATWRAHFGMKRGTGPDEVFPVSERFGYTPPDLISRAKGNGGKTRARKVASDYCAAYLIARWAIDVHAEYGTYDVPGTSRYDTAEVLKKDFYAESRNDDEDR